MSSIIPSLDQRLERLMGSDPVALAEPFGLWRELREQSPVHRRGTMVLVSRHEDVKRILDDDEQFQQNPYGRGRAVEEALAKMADEHVRLWGEVTDFDNLWLSRADGEEHGRLRRIANRAFTPRRIGEMRDSIQACADRLLDPLVESDGGDFMDFAWRFPLLVITDMLGIPEDEIDLVHRWTKHLGANRFGQDLDGTDLEPLLNAHRAIHEFRDYLDATVIERHRRNPDRTSLVGAMMGAEEEERLTSNELAAMFMILLFGGHETTTNLLSIGLLELARNPRQWELLCEEPARVDDAVEELLRFTSPVQYVGRVAAGGSVHGDVQIEAGDAVVTVLAAANRDPAVFGQPEQLDITRPDSRRHVAFGFGRHFCLGAALTRMEAGIAFRSLAERHAGLRVDEDGIRGWEGHAIIRRLTNLPVLLGQ